jgi:hypothetical protein
MNKKRTQAQTPAPPKDRIKGSKKNPQGSASGSRGSIKISEKTEKALVNLRNKHNDKYKAPSKRVDLGMLKAVYRRGSGAFSNSSEQVREKKHTTLISTCFPKVILKRLI